MEHGSYGSESGDHDEQTKLAKHADWKYKLQTKLIKEDFDKMKYMLDCGFNLLVYGYGSKRELINFFHQRQLDDMETIIFNGYHSALTIRTIIEKITFWFWGIIWSCFNSESLYFNTM